jgi:MYXO-CTERM domain-containing protein
MFQRDSASRVKSASGATWAMMLAGFGAAGAALRRRRIAIPA